MEEYNKKMEKYRHIYQRVEHNKMLSQDRTQLVLDYLKEDALGKIHGKAFEREKENMTERPSRRKV